MYVCMYVVIAKQALLLVSCRCEGRHSCQMRADVDQFGDPCRGVIGNYLEVQYACQ